MLSALGTGRLYPPGIIPGTVMTVRTFIHKEAKSMPGFKVCVSTFYDVILPANTVALGLTQPLTEMSKVKVKQSHYRP
jgi:hypothetical protein